MEIVLPSLRQRYSRYGQRQEDKISRLDATRKQREMVADALASAKRLEAEMVAEGLNITFEFFTFLWVILVTRDKLGRWAERGMRTAHNVKEYCKVHVHDRPSLQKLLMM